MNRWAFSDSNRHQFSFPEMWFLDPVGPNEAKAASGLACVGVKDIGFSFCSDHFVRLGVPYVSRLIMSSRRNSCWHAGGHFDRSPLIERSGLSCSQDDRLTLREIARAINAILWQILCGLLPSLERGAKTSSLSRQTNHNVQGPPSKEDATGGTILVVTAWVVDAGLLSTLHGIIHFVYLQKKGLTLLGITLFQQISSSEQWLQSQSKYWEVLVMESQYETTTFGIIKVKWNWVHTIYCF